MRSGVIYARFSSHNQKEESIEQQVDECTSFAKANDIEITQIYADKALSGRTDKRPAFQRMMRDAEKKAFSVVIAYKSNRIARNMLNALQYEEKLAKLGIETFYAREEYGNTPAGRLALRMMMSVNQFYSENLAEDIKRGMLDNARNAKVNGSIPIGYKKSAEGKYELDPKTAPIVQEIYDRTESGERFSDIAKDLNARNIRTKKGGTWNKSSFQWMLHNDIYTGIYRHSGIEISGAVPVIISKEQFDRVQNVLHTKQNPVGRHRGDMDYLLTGKLFCGLCGEPMIGTSATSHTGAKHYYYSCRRRARCKKKSVRKDYIEGEVCRIVRDCFLTDEVIAWVAHATMLLYKEMEENSDLPVLKAQLEEDERGLANLVSAVRQGLLSQTIKAEIERLEASSASLRKKIKKLEEEQSPITEEEIVFALIDFRNGNLEDEKYRKYLISALVKKVVLSDDEIEVDFYPTGRDTDKVRIKDGLAHHTLTIRTYHITVGVGSIKVKRPLT